MLINADQTATSQTFANPNGSLTYVASALPRWVKHGTSWVKASATLVPSAGGSWSPAAAESGLRLSGGGDGPLATVSDGQYRMSVSWPARLPAPKVSGATATYADVFPGVDLAVTAMVTGGFSETLIIENAAAARDPGLANLRLGLALSGGLSERVQKSGTLLVQNQGGTTVFSAAAPVAWDSSGVRSGPGSGAAFLAATPAGPPPGAHLAAVAARYAAGSIRIAMPDSLLASPSTRYPVDIDPSFNTSLTLQAYGEIQNNYPTTNEYNNTYDSEVFVGYDGANIDRGEYLFGLPSDADGPSVNVLSATLTGEVVGDFDGTTSTSHTVDAYYTSPYSTSTTWDNPPTEIDGPSATTFTTTSGTPDQNVSWSLASWVQNDLRGNGSQFSVQLINSQEGTNGSAFVEFSNDPTMTVSYVPSVPAGTGPVPNGTFVKFPVSDRVSLQVNVGSGNALLTTSDITLPQIAGPLALGAAYNSLDAGWGPLSMDANGWSQRQGVDTRLYQESNSNLLFLGPDGLSGTFTATVSGSTTTYSSPGNFHVTLEQSPSGTCGGTGWTMYWHDTGEKMCFSSSGYLTSQADRNGNTTAFAYNSSNQETQITYTPAGLSSPTETVNVTYSGCGCSLTSLSESGGSAGTKTVTYTWNSSGNISSVQQPDGTTINFGYDGSHDLTSITNGDNNTTKLNYNSSHQVTSVSQPTTGGNTATTRFDYVSSTETLLADPNTNQSDPVTSVPNVTYTIAPSTSLVTKAVDQAGDTVSTSYTSFDDVATYTNGAGGETTNTYGTNGGESLTASKSPTGATNSLAYGTANSGSDPTAEYEPSSNTDPQGNKSTFTYNGAGNVEQSVSALAATAKVSYNSDGTPATSTDPTGGVTDYTYNSSDQLSKITPPSGGSLQPVTITYDGFGRVATVTDGDGNTVTYTYDLEDQITKAAHTGGASAVTVTYAYDGAGNLKTQTDPSGTTSYTYDGLNLVLTKTATSGGGTLSYSYDADGNLASAADVGGTTTYTYNSRNLLASMTDPTGKLWEFAYNADNQRTTTWSDTNSSESTWAGKLVTSYDPSGRISRIQAYSGDSTSNVVSDVSYCYSKYVSGQSCPTASASTDTSLVQYSTNNQTAVVSQYSYDAGNRVTSVTNDGGKTYSYGYDSDGNLTSGAAYGTLTYNESNQITSTGFSYDGAGNMNVSSINGSQSYNDAGQMTSVGDANGNGSENFTYAGDTQDEVLSDGSATGITYGLAAQDGQPWAQSYSPAASTSPVYVLHDQQGHPARLRPGRALLHVRHRQPRLGDGRHRRLRLRRGKLRLRPIRQPHQQERRRRQRQPAPVHRCPHRHQRQQHHRLRPRRRPLVRSRHRQLHHPGRQQLSGQSRRRQPLCLRRRQPRQLRRSDRHV